MKKIVKFLFVSVALINGTKAYAQSGSSFEGKITYSIEMQGLPPEAASMMAGSEMVVYTKNQKSRTEMSMGMMSKTVSIVDQKAKTAVTLMDMMGQKYMMKSNTDETKKETKTPEPQIKYLPDTKEIAGYKCKKAQITLTDKDGKSNNTFDMWYTDQFPYYSYKDMYKGLKGLPMEFEMKQGQMNMKMTAKSVSKESVPDNKFDIPEGYKETTPEELQKNMMKGGQ